MKKSNAVRGNCYVTSEALFHLLGGKRAGWKPMTMRVYAGTHWFLVHTETGLIVDPTAAQFFRPLDYSKARGRGFLTKRPSKRAVEMMARMLYGLEWPDNLPKLPSKWGI